MYKNPIDVIVSDIETQMAQQMENAVYEAVQNIGVDVDKDELIKALQNDRDQYNAGWRDAVEYMQEKIIKDLENIYDEVWGVDIPSPTVPEYVEHHHEMVMLMNLIKEKIEKWERME